ncbi:MAG: tetratricopeptide repeat protein [Gammaproteobacteria bacterium]|nr:tetratricopeptide repeat protein [Gammaproteobacteria bacterium]MCP5198623.1 tetratricopeptide repeat protein [Gammaproteobacteria bacterium]
MLRGLLLLVFLLAPLLATAAEGDGQKTKQTVAMSQPVFEGLKKAQEQIEAKQYGAAQGELKKLREKSDLSPYETAQIWNLTAYGYYLQENYKQAIGAYLQVLKQDGLPEALEQSTLKTLSQLYFTVEDYAKALTVVDRLIAAIAEPSPDVLMLKGQAHFQLEQYKQALAPIKSAIEKYRAQGKTPQENWLLLLRVSYFELGDFKNMISVLKELITLYPKDQYLLTLAGVYSELGDTKKQLALTEALYESGRLSDPSQVVNLANLYLVHNNPYKAAKLLDAELGGRVEESERNLRLLSQAWYQAREDEKAIPPLARAAKMSGDGELYLRLAQSYINLDRWAEAAEAVEQGLAKGGIKRVDTANIMLGMALFNQRKLDAARKAFVAAASDKRSASAARQWIAFVDSEMTRDKTLDQTLPEQAQRKQDAILENL